MNDYFMEVLIGSAESIFVVGGGWSLEDFDWSRLEDKFVIAVNRSFEKLPNAKIIYFSDKQFFDWFKTSLLQHKGIKCCGAHGMVDENVFNCPFTGAEGLEKIRWGVRSGNNSSYAAMNLALHLKPKRIILLGVDMKIGQEGKVYWHEGYAGIDSKPRKFSKMLPFFDGANIEFKRLGIEVLNASPSSELEEFKKITLDDAVQF